MIKNTDELYGSVAKFLHWLMAIVIICMLIIGFFLADLKEPLLYKAHKAVGFLVLLLAIARLMWRFFNQVPDYDSTFPKLMALAGHAAHYFLYVLMIAMPLSAFIASNAALRPTSFLFLFDMPLLFSYQNLELSKFFMKIHSVLAVILIITISLHILAAFYHHFIRKDNILMRMLPSLFQFKRMKH